MDRETVFWLCAWIRCPGLVVSTYANVLFLSVRLSIPQCVVYACTCSVCVCIFFCVVIVGFDLVIAKSVFHVFCFLFSCVLNRNLLLVVYNFLCVFVHVCWFFHMGYAITLFPHWSGMKICIYSFLRWEIMIIIYCLYCAGECR